MKNIMIALAGAGLLALAGCASTTPAKTEAPKAVAKPQAEAPKKTELTEDAKMALAMAEADVKAAKAKNALWTTAQDALKKAKDAAEKIDSASVIKHAKIASEHAQLGIAQTQYPVLTISK